MSPEKDGGGRAYSPHYIEFDDGPEMEQMEAGFGSDGYRFYHRVKGFVFRTPAGYLFLGDQKDVKLLAYKIRITAKKFIEMADYAAKVGLFDEPEWRENRVLTSAEIRRQVEYANAREEQKRKENERKGRHWEKNKDKINAKRRKNGSFSPNS